MKKPLKILGITIGGVLALLIILAVTLTLLFDPNDYKGKIIEAVKDKTGRELRIEGKLGWSFFPWIGIETGRLELANAPGFGIEPFARIDGAGAKVELLPLLGKQVIVDTVFLDGLKLHLARNAAGKTNWDDLVKPPGAEQPAEKTIPGKQPAVGGIGINKVDIRQADVTWKDQRSGEQYAVHNLNLKTGKIIGGTPVDMQLSFDLESGQPPVRTRVDLKSKLGLDIDGQKLEVASLTLSLGDLTLLASFKGTHVFDAPVFDGTLEISSFNPRTLMDKLGVKIETADKNALNKLSLKTKFAATTDSAELKDLAINLDDSRLNGSLAVRHFASPAYQFDLTLDQIDLDRYLSPAAPAPAAAGSKQTATAPAKPVEIPLSALRALAVQGKFRVLQLKAMNLRSNDALVQVTADNGLITLGPNQAKLYSGKYAGRTTLNVRGKQPVLKFEEQLNNIEIGPFLGDAKFFPYFSGTGNVDLQLTATGLDAAQIKRNLNGKVEIALHDGAISNIDLLKKIDELRDLYDKLRGKSVSVKGNKNEKTVFSTLGGSILITDGVAHNSNLLLQSKALRANGKGSANLVEEKLDYRLAITRTKDEGKECASFPMRVTGPFNDLDYGFDYDEFLQCQTQKKKTEIKEKVKEQFQEKLQDKLRRFR